MHIHVLEHSNHALRPYSMLHLTLLRCHKNSNVTDAVGSFQTPNASMTSLREIRNLYDNSHQIHHYWQMSQTDYKNMSHFSTLGSLKTPRHLNKIKGVPCISVLCHQPLDNPA